MVLPQEKRQVLLVQEQKTNESLLWGGGRTGWARGTRVTAGPATSQSSAWFLREDLPSFTLFGWGKSHSKTGPGSQLFQFTQGAAFPKAIPGGPGSQGSSAASYWAQHTDFHQTCPGVLGHHLRLPSPLGQVPLKDPTPFFCWS